jgi:hypothetical protein
MKRDIERYAEHYLVEYGFERMVVGCRRRVVLDQLVATKPAVVLEIGCGTELQYQHYLRLADPVESWIVVEPSREFSSRAREATLPGMNVVEGFLEESLATVAAALPKAPDLVICSGLLHEVPSSQAMLQAIRVTMDCRSLLHINVPNARSLHRRIAVAMGLIPELSTMSESNLKFQQHRVYDFASLTRDLETAGFAVMQTGGYLVKPFTHRQMEAIAPTLGDDVLEGLFELGKRDPDMACEIFVNAKVAA